VRIGGESLGQGVLADVRRRYGELVANEEQAVLSSQRLQAGVEAFGSRKEAVKAGYTVALARQQVDEAFAALGDPHGSGLRADDLAPARAATDELLRAAADLERRLGGEDAPEVLCELRLASADLRLVFAAESPQTAVLLVVGIGREDWGEWYDEALPLARAELQREDEDFTTYDRAAFLSEYFPGEKAEVQAGAPTAPGAETSQARLRPGRLIGRFLVRRAFGGGAGVLLGDVAAQLGRGRVVDDRDQRDLHARDLHEVLRQLQRRHRVQTVLQEVAVVLDRLQGQQRRHLRTDDVAQDSFALFRGGRGQGLPQVAHSSHLSVITSANN
jgi:hypothetical protein